MQRRPLEQLATDHVTPTQLASAMLQAWKVPRSMYTFKDSRPGSLPRTWHGLDKVRWNIRWLEIIVGVAQLDMA